MALKMSQISLISLIVVVLWSRATAQSGCTMALVGLSPCLNYVTGNSSTPTSSCCTSLSGVVQSQPQCLCALLKGGSSSLGIAINQTLALALPGACNVQTPPVSQCNAANGPPASAPTPAAAYSPSDSPADETPDIVPSTPSEPDIVPSTPSAGTGSKTVPNTNAASSGGSNAVGFLGVFFLLLASTWAYGF
ncbi:hypothetical protein Salat_2242000 [Sesamum alatum]|uniref:Bifunctional inhibitor/plant lipid transfer protein/seed storage helical domain-containing protein n=1 Tax=Sesamum alatum TaxID=300844 RepID=A0AAE2CDL2_9LAMI|nr:hypothetical protein Salat_2242000 [Sesamum alatum]